MGLPWGERHDSIPDIQGYRYYYGDIRWGTVAYLGKEDLAEMETEIQLVYSPSTRKIAQALLILGPAGLNDYNCIKKYKEIINLLSEKYGKFHLRETIKDPAIDDLLSASVCHPVQAGLHQIKTLWKSGDYILEAYLVGEAGEFYIEILYTNIGQQKRHSVEKRQRAVKRL